jgi:hypothetical protein
LFVLNNLFIKKMILVNGIFYFPDVLKIYPFKV